MLRRTHPFLGLLVSFGLIAASFADATAGTTVLVVNCGDSTHYGQIVPNQMPLATKTSWPAGVTFSPAPVDVLYTGVETQVEQIYAPYVDPVPADVASIDPDMAGQAELYTSLKLANGTVLTVGNLAPNKLYRVALHLGAISPAARFAIASDWTYFDTASRVSVDALLNGSWRPVAKNVDCRAVANTNPSFTWMGTVIETWVLAKTDASGRLQLRFNASQGSPLIAKFEVVEYAQPAIEYSLQSGKLLKANAPGVAAFVNAFNAKDFAGARAAALAIANPRERGLAMSFQIGALSGEFDSIDLVEPAKQALQTAVNQGDAQALYPLRQMAIFERALDHLLARGYSKAFDGETGAGFLNPEGANLIATNKGMNIASTNAWVALRYMNSLVRPVGSATVVRDLSDWSKNLISSEQFQPSPLTLVAAKWTGVLPYMINPRLSNGGTPDAWQQQMIAIFNDFTQLFYSSWLNHDRELKLYSVIANAKKNPHFFSAAEMNVFTDQEIESAWWAPLVQLTADVPNAPKWANSIREFRRIYGNLVSFWLRHHFDGDELGGGWGDDVELIAQLAPYFGSAVNGIESFNRDRFQALTAYGFDRYAPMVEGKGYAAGPITDAEHSAESSTNAFLSELVGVGSSRRALKSALDTTRYLLDPSAPVNFAAPTNTGQVHFKSNYFTASAVSNDPTKMKDMPINLRAVVPGVAAGLRSPLGANHPLKVDLGKLAAGWRVDTMSAAAGKPAGFAPGYVNIPWNNWNVQGSPTWYSPTGSTGDTSLFTSTYYYYVTELMRRAGQYDASLQMLQAVKSWEDSGSSSASPGTPQWAAKQLRYAPDFGRLVYNHLHDYETKGVAAPSTLLTRMHSWVTGYTDQNAAMRYAMKDVAPCAPKSAKVTTEIEAVLNDAVYRMRQMVLPANSKFPAANTDRVFLPVDAIMTMLFAATGSDLGAEGYHPLIRIVGPDDVPLDLATLVNGIDFAPVKVSAFVYNFAPQPVAVTLQLEEALPPGNYRVLSAPSVSGCDDFETAPSLAGTVDKVGAAASVPMIFPPGCTLFRIEKTTAPVPPSQKYDLCVDAPDLVIDESKPGQMVRVRARISNLGDNASPAAQAKITLHLVFPNGDRVPGVAPKVAFNGSVASLPRTANYDLPTKEIVVPLGDSSIWVKALAYNIGVRVTLDVTPGAFEDDTTNNRGARSWFLNDLVEP